MVTVHIHRDFKMSHNYLIFLILGDHAKVRRAIKVMQGYECMYRLRVGQYRLIYQIKQSELIVFVLKAGGRGDIYKDM